MTNAITGGGAQWKPPAVGETGKLELKVGDTVIAKGVLCKNLGTGENIDAWDRTGLTTRINVGTDAAPNIVRVWSASIGFAKKEDFEAKLHTEKASEAKLHNTRQSCGAIIQKMLPKATPKYLESLIKRANELENNSIDYVKSKSGKTFWMAKDKDGNFDVLLTQKPIEKKQSRKEMFVGAIKMGANLYKSVDLSGKNSAREEVTWTISEGNVDLKKTGPVSGGEV